MPPRTEPTTSAADVDLRIDRLVLHGVPPRHHARVVAEMKTELGRLLASEDPAAWSARRLPRLDAGSVTVRRGDGPAAVGRQLAKQLHGRLRE